MFDSVTVYVILIIREEKIDFFREALGSMNSRLSGMILSITDLIFPNRCHFCSEPLIKRCCICNECQDDLELITKWYCSRCGAPLTAVFKKQRDNCSQCEDLIFTFGKNESLGVFTGKLRELIHLYKFNKRRSLYRFFSRLIIQNKRSFILSHDILIPVPLNRARYSERGFNQSFLIAREIAKAINMNFYGSILDRKGKSNPQSSIASRNERLINICDVFTVKNKWEKTIAGRNVLLFDDVLTTGATVSVCAEALYKSGANNVDVLTIARSLMEPSTV